MSLRELSFRNISNRNINVKSAAIFEHPHGSLFCTFSTSISDPNSQCNGKEIYLSRLRPESRKWDEPFSCMRIESAGKLSYMMFLDLMGSLQLIYSDGNVIWRKISYNYGKNWNNSEKIFGDTSGWKFGLHPVFLKHGRTIIPVFNNLTGRSFAFISEDGIKNWFVSTYIEVPEDIQEDEVIGFKPSGVSEWGAFKAKHPVFIPEEEDVIVAFLQTENLRHIHRARAEHYGEIWSETEITAIPSDSSAIDAIRLRNSEGNYTTKTSLVFTDKNEFGNSLNIAVTNDFGKNWGNIIKIESKIKVNISLPCLTQTPDLKTHLVYVLNGKEIKHAEFKIK